VFIDDGKRQSDVEVPPEFWWARGDAGLTQNWDVGDFETMAPDFGGLLRAFGVTFRRSDIEQLKPATAAKAAPSSVERFNLESCRTDKLSVPVASRKVFIVHGRDENAKNQVALFLRKIGLEDIVLHQRPNRGRNLLTKFQEDAEGSSFAVILMTRDDDGGLAGGPQQKRARQNVVFELGFFIGKFDTPRVAALIVPGVEKPSDFDGICWREFGHGTNWKNELARELKEAGVPFDSDAILHA
jgi:predicted nucleotide-binding protein